MAGYARTVDLGLIGGAAPAAGLGPPPLPGQRPVPPERTALIVVGSDRGLCGGYNDKIARFARSRMADGPVDLGVIGAPRRGPVRGGRRAARLRLTLPGSVDGLSRLVQRVILEIDRWTHVQGVRQVCCCINRREGPSAAQPTAHHLLPLPENYLHRLSEVRLAGPVTATVPDGTRPADVVAGATAALRGDTTARWPRRWPASMPRVWPRCRRPSATSRTGATTCSSVYRQRRQETITRELLDVVSGFEAVSIATRTP